MFVELGAVSYQKRDRNVHVIANVSSGLNKSQRNYTAHKLAFLALKWVITEEFRDYLYGKTFTAITDYYPLTYELSTAKLDVTGHRWVAALSAFDIDIFYRSCRNSDSDALSRLPCIECNEYIPI